MRSAIGPSLMVAESVWESAIAGVPSTPARESEVESETETAELESVSVPESLAANASATASDDVSASVVVTVAEIEAESVLVRASVVLRLKELESPLVPVSGVLMPIRATVSAPAPVSTRETVARTAVESPDAARSAAVRASATPSEEVRASVVETVAEMLTLSDAVSASEVVRVIEDTVSEPAAVSETAVKVAAMAVESALVRASVTAVSVAAMAVDSASVPDSVVLKAMLVIASVTAAESVTAVRVAATKVASVRLAESDEDFATVPPVVRVPTSAFHSIAPTSKDAPPVVYIRNSTPAPIWSLSSDESHVKETRPAAEMVCVPRLARKEPFSQSSNVTAVLATAIDSDCKEKKYGKNVVVFASAAHEVPL